MNIYCVMTVKPINTIRDVQTSLVTRIPKWAIDCGIIAHVVDRVGMHRVMWKASCYVTVISIDERELHTVCNEVLSLEDTRGLSRDDDES